MVSIAHLWLSMSSNLRYTIPFLMIISFVMLFLVAFITRTLKILALTIPTRPPATFRRPWGAGSSVDAALHPFDSNGGREKNWLTWHALRMFSQS